MTVRIHGLIRVEILLHCAVMGSYDATIETPDTFTITKENIIPDYYKGVAKKKLKLQSVTFHPIFSR
jgi:hypothetical protein